ncbi:tRNA (guanine-N(7)-)-methyltransferase non-catalytic subunit wdr4 [Scleropages formosus]|nr:tRNA (guanine-N(7)-)-methyltransferase non-catalytic subunit WDR4 [Scleropages formosus]
MAALKACGCWIVSASGEKLIAVPTDPGGEPFVFDCSRAEKNPQETGKKGDDGGNEEPGSDRVLALAASPSGTFCALADDAKRLVLFGAQPTWRLISTRWVVRRCTSLAFTGAEDELLAADKSGDVYSFSVSRPQRPGELRLGHLSMLLAVAVTPDDKYIITADRDEKVRVSILKSPYNIQSFCLGHREFVSALCVPAVPPRCLLSGSGDGTLKLWEYESGRRLQSWDLKEPSDMSTADTGSEMRLAVCSLVSSPDGGHVAVLCESIPKVHLFRAEPGPEGHLASAQVLTLSHCAWDVTFDPQGRLWILVQEQEHPVVLFTRTEGGWERVRECAELSRVEETLRTHWDTFQDSMGADGRFQHLYKVNFDNMASYLQKKQERIQQQNEKKGRKRAAEHPRCNSTKKKTKEGGAAQPGS